MDAGGGWQVVTKRKQASDWKTNKDETSIFLSNLPDDCTNVILWKIFKSFRKMVDTYILAWKDRGGRKFGFLKFQFVKDSNSLVESMNAVKIDGMKIDANVSLYLKNSCGGQ